MPLALRQVNERRTINLCGSIMKPKTLNFNKEIIEKLKSCKDRFDNFKEKYPDFSGDLQAFLEL